jgi:hypothetical protein
VESARPALRSGGRELLGWGRYGHPATTALKIRPTRRRPAAPSAPPHSRAIRFPRAALPAPREPSSKVRSRQPSDLGRLGRRHRRRERSPRPPELLILRRVLSPAKDGWLLGENLHVHLGTDLAAVPIPGERRPELGPGSVPDPQQIAEQSKGGRSAALLREAELCSKPQVCFAHVPLVPLCRSSYLGLLCCLYHRVDLSGFAPCCCSLCLSWPAAVGALSAGRGGYYYAATPLVG